MSKSVVHTFFGKYSKYEVIKDSKLLGVSFYVLKDGKHDASFSALDKAVEYAQKKAGK